MTKTKRTFIGMTWESWTVYLALSMAVFYGTPMHTWHWYWRILVYFFIVMIMPKHIVWYPRGAKVKDDR